MNIKTKALIETAKAYMSRGRYLQYDQRCMDRITQLSPRRAKLLPPEAATSQRTLFLDCSSFVGAVYYQTFGYEPESDLTWHMIDIIKPRVFYYELTHKETEEEKSEITKKITGTLIPGDVIVYDRYRGSGHTMLYIGNKAFLHCTTNGRPNSYDYENCKSREYPDGGIFEISFDKVFTDTRIYKENVRRIAVLRPLERMGEVTENSLKRLCETKGLICSVELSHYGGRCILPGEDAVYTVNIENTTDDNREITVSLCCGQKNLSESITVKAKSTGKVSFSETPTDFSGFYTKSPVIKANGMDLYVHPVLTGKAKSALVTESVIKGIAEGIPAYDSAAKALGITDRATEKAMLHRLFYLHDNPGGDVLSRRPQNPESDLAVYSYFGGKGVTTPETISFPHIRTTKVTKQDLMPGDIIITADDACFNITHSYYYTGCEILSTDKITSIDELTDSMPGQFVFVIIRPSNTKINNEVIL